MVLEMEVIKIMSYSSTKKSEEIKIRCTPEQKRRMEVNAEKENKNLSCYVRDVAISRRKQQKKNLREEKEVKDILVKITEACNQYHAGIDKEEMMDVIVSEGKKLWLFLK